jgi:hypothetical protein
MKQDCRSRYSDCADVVLLAKALSGRRHFSRRQLRFQQLLHPCKPEQIALRVPRFRNAV